LEPVCPFFLSLRHNDSRVKDSTKQQTCRRHVFYTKR